MMASAFIGYVSHGQKGTIFQEKSKQITMKSVRCVSGKGNPSLAISFRKTVPGNSSAITSLNYSYFSQKANLDSELSPAISLFLEKYKLSPVYVYEDLHLKITQRKILQDLKGKAGVYCILNKVTFDFYIGSASTNRFYSRFSNHLLYLRGSSVIKEALKNSKLQKFAFLILEIFPLKVNRETNKQLLLLEDFYLKTLLPNYNILTEAGNSFGYNHSQATRLKMKRNFSLERRYFIMNLNKGKFFASETIEKMRESAFNRKKPVFTAQALQNMKKKSKKVYVYTLEGIFVDGFASIKDAAVFLNCSRKTVYRALRSSRKIVKKE